MNQPARTTSWTGPREARLTIAQFYRVQETGVFEDFAKTELLDGRISVMNSQYLPHMRVKMAIYDAFRAAIGRGGALDVGVAGAIELGMDNVPEPDVFIFDARDAQRGAPDGSVRLVVEVADSSERRDLGRKKRIYARHGIAEYWVALLRTRRIERFADPVDGDYRRHDGFAFSARVESLTLSGVAMPAGTLSD